jgi:hypothetical protein
MEPRKVIGSVDTSEFLVALAASAGFLAALGSQGIKTSYVVALLAGGVVAAPIAAWFVRIVTARLLGAAVGGLILITNTRTIFDAFEVSGNARDPVYVVLALVWVAAVSFVVYKHRRDGIPLTHGWRRERSGEPATESS